MDSRLTRHSPGTQRGCEVSPEFITPPKQQFPSLRSCKNNAASAISLRSFQLVWSESRTLGPGYYNIPHSTLGGPIFEFSRSTRLLKGSPYLPLGPLPRTDNAKNLIALNKQVTNHYPEEKLRKINELALAYSERAKGVQLRKLELRREKNFSLGMRQERKELIQSFRENRQDFLKVAKGWLSLLTIIGASGGFVLRKETRLVMRQRSDKHVTFLCYFCIAIGKFKMTLFRARILKNNGVIRRFVLRIRLKKKMTKEKLRKSLCTTVTHFVNTTLTKTYLFKVIATFNNKILFIQRTIRKLLALKQMGILMRKRTWAQLESKLTRKTPEIIMEVFIRQLLKSRAKEYHERMKHYIEECHFIRSNADILHSRVLPFRPDSSYLFTAIDYPCLRITTQPYIN